MNPMSPNYIGSQIERELNSHFVNGTPIVSDDANAIFTAMMIDDRRLTSEIKSFLDGQVSIEDLSQEAYCFLTKMLEDHDARQHV